MLMLITPVLSCRDRPSNSDPSDFQASLGSSPWRRRRGSVPASVPSDDRLLPRQV